MSKIEVFFSHTGVKKVGLARWNDSSDLVASEVSLFSMEQTDKQQQLVRGLGSSDKRTHFLNIPGEPLLLKNDTNKSTLFLRTGITIQSTIWFCNFFLARTGHLLILKLF